MATDDLTLAVGGQIFGGWQTVRITRGIERMPSDFDIGLTELYPGQADRLSIQPGQECEVRLGGDVVLTGRIDRYHAAISAEGHSVRVQGRGRCRNLVDCAAGIREDDTYAMQISGGDALKIASDLAQPFGIKVTRRDDEAGNTIPQFNVTFGETAFEIIDRVARYRQLLAYEATDGNLILARAGSDIMGSGFVMGENIEAASVTLSVDERFSDYYAVWTSVDSLSGIGQAGGTSGFTHARVRDASMTEFRPYGFVSEQFIDGRDIAQDRAVWEMNRRNGRARAISLTCDSWRDIDGRLWEPNARALVDAPQLKLPSQFMLIGEVTFRRGEDGTHADLILMPPEAYEPAPTGLTGMFQIQQALPGGGAAQ